MRLGRIPDLGMYGLAGDEALAVKDFVAGSMLGLEAEMAFGLPLISESADKHNKHKSYADHYRRLSDHHKRSISHYNELAKNANKEGRPFTAARHQSKIELLRKLYSSHAALCDYHDCEAERYREPDLPAEPEDVPEGAGPTKVDQPKGEPMKSGHPKPGSTAAQAKQVPSDRPALEQTTAASLAPFMKLPSAFIQRSSIKPVSTKWEKKKRGEENEWVRKESREGLFKRMPMIEDMLDEAKKKNAKKKKSKSEKKSGDKELGFKVDPDKVDEAFANAKLAPLFQHLGHKIDHAEAKVAGGKVKSTWSDKLYKTCLSKGGSAAADEVVRASLTQSWLRDQGYVDEASNLRRKWETAMSAETQENAIRASATTPEPAVFTINRMIDIAQGRGSIY